MNGKIQEKLKNKIAKIINYIENIKEWQWLLITFLISLIAIISVSIRILWEPYVHAEMGGHFINDAMLVGKKSLFMIRAGYLEVLPRLFAIIAVYFGKKYNSIILVAYIVKWCAIIFPVIVANYFNSKEFKPFIKSRIIRLLTTIIIIYSMGRYTVMLYTGVTTHWWGGFLAFLVSLSFLNKKMPPMYIMPFLILSILSSPSALIVGIPIVYYLITKIKLVKQLGLKNIILKNKLKILMLILIFIAAITQIYAVFIVGNRIQLTSKDAKENYKIIDVLLDTTKATIKTIPEAFSFKIKLLNNILTSKINGILGLIIIAILIWRYAKKGELKILIWSLLSIFTLWFIVIYRRIGNDQMIKGLSFYIAIQSVIGIMLVLKWLYDDIYSRNIILKIFAVLIFIFLIAITYLKTEKPSYEFCNDLYSVEKYVDFKSQKTTEVRFPPSSADWKLSVPINENYTKNPN